MGTSVNLSNKLVSEARSSAKIYNRSTAGQIEYWSRIGAIAEANPDLTYDFIMGVLQGLKEAEEEKGTEYKGCL